MIKGARHTFFRFRFRPSFRPAKRTCHSTRASRHQCWVASFNFYPCPRACWDIGPSTCRLNGATWCHVKHGFDQGRDAPTFVSNQAHRGFRLSCGTKALHAQCWQPAAMLPAIRGEPNQTINCERWVWHVQASTTSFISSLDTGYQCLQPECLPKHQLSWQSITLEFGCSVVLVSLWITEAMLRCWKSSSLQSRSLEHGSNQEI